MFYVTLTGSSLEEEVFDSDLDVSCDGFADEFDLICISLTCAT